ARAMAGRALESPPRRRARLVGRLRVGRGALHGGGRVRGSGAPARPGVALPPGPGGRDRYRPDEPRAYRDGRICRGGVLGGAARADLPSDRRVTRKAKEPPAPRERVVKVADWAAERGDVVIVTLGLGSCVAIMLHDSNAGAGAMAHILLPSKSLARDATNLAKFPETAVPLLVEQLTTLGAEPRRLVAKLVGGASMFAQLMTPGSVQMGERNVAAAR